MSLATTDVLTAPELERLLREIEPAAVFVPRTILRRVVRHDSRLSGLGLRVPHSVCYTIGREALLGIVDRHELGPAGSAELPERVVLIRRPEPDKLAKQSRPQVLLFHWRVLFHARVHLTLESRAAEGKLTAAEARHRWQCLGDPARHEIVSLLHQERCATAEDPVSLWVEFAAFYLGLRYFLPERLADYLPGLRDLSAVDELLGKDLDADSLLAATRPPGAPDAAPAPRPPELPDEDLSTTKLPEGPSPAPAEHRFLIRRAERAAGRGNDVRAAILRARAWDYVEAEADLDRLVGRLQKALPESAAGLDACRVPLSRLLGRACQGFWPQGARLLYDLQKICIDLERPLYKVDLAAWLRSLGRRPIRRLVPGQREVLAVQYLRSAVRRLPRARLPDSDREQLGAVLREALYRAEARLRATFRPLLTAALDEVGFRPRNLPERAALHKITEELLDRIEAHGLLTLSDLRDAFSRNDLKLEDLGGPVEFLQGDRMHRLDRKLAGTTESVYRRGEFYLRWLQSLSSLAFGTPLGRLITTWLALPFGGAFVILEGVQHLAHLLAKHVTHHEVHLMRPLTVALLGLFLVGVLNFPTFRKRVGQVLHGFGHLLYWLLIAGPRSLFDQPLVRWVVNSPPVLFARRFLIKPALCAGLVWLFAWLHDSGREWRILWTVSAFVLAAMFLSSRVGRALEELAADRLIDAWHHLGELFPALFRFVMGVFKAFLQGVDRLLYTVDEWLRFRKGEGRAALAAKAILGFLWSGVAYVIRFALTLLIEPQVNPIKHFPVVTVAHKVMLPFIPALAAVLRLTLDAPLALTLATGIIFCTPGLFGFLVWELKENFRLYAANRPKDVRPVVVGSHGETVLRFLRPGFHSGTVPKAFARLRRAVHRGDPRKRAARAARQREVLHHVEDAVRHFVQSDLLYVLRESGRWEGTPLRAGRVVLGLHSLQMEFLQENSRAHLWVEFEETGGRLAATVRDQGLLGELGGGQRRVLRNAMIGFYKKVGVAVVTAQVAKCLEPQALTFRLTEEGLAVVLPAGGEEVVYDLDGERRIVPQRNGAASRRLPTFRPRELLFAADPLTWDGWVDVWECEEAGYAKELLKGLPLWTSPAEIPEDEPASLG